MLFNIKVAHWCGSLRVNVACVVGVRPIGLDRLPVLVESLVQEVPLSRAMTSV